MYFINLREENAVVVARSPSVGSGPGLLDRVPLAALIRTPISGHWFVHFIPYVESCRRTFEDPRAGVKEYPWLT